MFEVELKANAPGAWIDQFAVRLNALVKVLEFIPQDDEGGRFLFEIFTRQPSPGDLDARLDELKKQFDLEIIPYKKGMYLGNIVLDHCIICKAITLTNSYLTYVRGFPDHNVEIHLIIRQEKDLKTLLATFEQSTWNVELISKTHVTARNLVTTREEDVIKTALEHGYYDFPKKVNLRELADSLGISHSTLNEILHRGEKKILREYYSLEE
jgi:hypothetical protein